jgi:hypothetical protein
MHIRAKAADATTFHMELLLKFAKLSDDQVLYVRQI